MGQPALTLAAQALREEDGLDASPTMRMLAPTARAKQLSCVPSCNVEINAAKCWPTVTYQR